MLVKKTIKKFKYGADSADDTFNVKQLLSRNSSNHVLSNKKSAFVVQTKPKNSHHLSASSSIQSIRSSFGQNRRNKEADELKKALAVDEDQLGESNTYEFYMNHLVEYADLIQESVDNNKDDFSSASKPSRLKLVQPPKNNRPGSLQKIVENRLESKS